MAAAIAGSAVSSQSPFRLNGTGAVPTVPARVRSLRRVPHREPCGGHGRATPVACAVPVPWRAAGAAGSCPTTSAGWPWGAAWCRALARTSISTRSHRATHCAGRGAGGSGHGQPGHGLVGGLPPLPGQGRVTDGGGASYHHRTQPLALSDRRGPPALADHLRGGALGRPAHAPLRPQRLTTLGFAKARPARLALRQPGPPPLRQGAPGDPTAALARCVDSKEIGSYAYLRGACHLMAARKPPTPPRMRRPGGTTQHAHLVRLRRHVAGSRTASNPRSAVVRSARPSARRGARSKPAHPTG